MKKKDLIYALLAVVILLVAGYLGYSQLKPKSAASSVVVVEKVGIIPAHLDANGLARLNDRNMTTDYNTAVDFSGLGNKAPFGK